MGSGEEQDERYARSGRRIGLAVFVVGMAGLVWAVVTYEPETYADRAADYRPSGDDAERMCREDVAGKLKAPSTAEFGGVDSSISDDFDIDEWTVTGWVDSENSFGAMLRTDWTCDAIHTGGGNWRTRTALG